MNDQTHQITLRFADGATHTVHAEAAAPFSTPRFRRARP
jgi:hypothetical protein